MEELSHGNALSPRHVSACLESVVHVIEVEIGRVVSDIRQRHVCIHELHCLTLLGSQWPAEYSEILFVTESLAALLEITGEATLFIKVLLRIDLPERQQCHHRREQYGKCSFHIFHF